MPGTHLTSFIYRTWGDVGGCDYWVDSWYTPTTRWYEGWHSPKPLELWFKTEPNAWNFIGWEKWQEGPGLSPRIIEVQFLSPNPALMPKKEWRNWMREPSWVEKITYSDQDQAAPSEWLSTTNNPWLATGEYKGSFLGKGAPNTKGKDTHSKGSGAPKGPGSNGTGGGKKGDKGNGKA